jgi:TatD DNase family protein
MTGNHLLFDTHVHLDFPPLYDHLDAVLAAARMAGVADFLVPGVERGGWRGLLAIGGTPGVWVAPGLHPLAAAQWDEGAATELAELLGAPQAVAVGEIGLDRLLDVPMAVQENAFRGQVRLAVTAGKPIIIHHRRAAARLLGILREEGAQRVGGIFHSFSGSVEIAREAINLGFAIGFGGSLTWPGARRPGQVLTAIPAEWIVLETDAPDLPPAPNQGKENQPAWLPLIAAKVTELRGWSLQETAAITTANARRILRLTDRKIPESDRCAR